mmetsp:Transcript_13301/g.11784  ORF Transcript_13301/g.11784 Transcript_13301/m.11784 type:complete len:93 (+) Transcript_13301:1039-1317(+)
MIQDYKAKVAENAQRALDSLNRNNQSSTGYNRDNETTGSIRNNSQTKTRKKMTRITEERSSIYMKSMKGSFIAKDSMSKRKRKIDSSRKCNQ